MKKIYLLNLLMLSGCATTSSDYLSYMETSSRLQQSVYATESACLLVLAEAMKTADAATKIAISNQIDKCKKDLPRIDPPRKNWLGF
jgi:hypothetical protein